MVDGQRIHRVIGLESDGTTRTQAEDFISGARADAKMGRLSLPKGRKTHLTFRHAADDYIDRLEDTGGKNLVAKKRQLERYLTPFFGDQRLDAITTFTVDRYKKRRLDTGATNGTVNRELATLSHMLNKSVEWKWLISKPCKVSKLEEAEGRITALTDNQVEALINAAVADEEPDCWLFVVFGLNTAMRHGEMLRARFDQIDFEHNRLFLPKAKAGQREQPLTSELVAILKREREIRDDRDGWIFPSPRPNASLAGHRYRMDKPFRRAAIAAGFDPNVVTPHVMRHTAITRLVQAGVDLPTIQTISGHKTLAMVLRYAHVHGQHIDSAISALGTAIPEPVVNKPADTTTQELHIRSNGRK
jgi:integrase